MPAIRIIRRVETHYTIGTDPSSGSTNPVSDASHSNDTLQNIDQAAEIGKTVDDICKRADPVKDILIWNICQDAVGRMNTDNVTN
ncbi:hypothetical protein ACJMK2_026623 [Sinanodonta woodiana]|uniref:Uncharacterized protein n=1 Tax=Sinanodonta woodiana TaxID=1069815 RepID=A0ABD3XNL5_SINWO